MMEQTERGGIYIHESFTKLQQEQGSGWYDFTERVGLGGVFYLSSRGAIPYNPDPSDSSVPYHDIYDILRAVELGHVTKLEKRRQVTEKAGMCGDMTVYEAKGRKCLLIEGHRGNHANGSLEWTRG